VLRSESPGDMCAKLRTVAASNNRDHATHSLLLLVRATYIYCCFSRTSRSWRITQSTRRHQSGCNMGVRGSRKGYGNRKRISFFVGFFFSSSSGTLQSMTIKRPGHLCPTRVSSLQLAINPATYTSDCDSTSSGRHNLHHENINLT